MGDLKTRVQGLEPSILPRDIDTLIDPTGNIYESLVVISTRARQINRDLKIELHQKLDEFATHTDAIEEIHENKEQIEISKFYERLPNPVIIGYNEFVDENLEYSYPLLEQAALDAASEEPAAE
jgi:DNA-directed RNA polymerase subunit K/omega